MIRYKVMREIMALFALVLSAATAAAGDRLHDAVAAGDTGGVEKILGSGESVDVRASDQATPLMAAALGGKADIVELLLSKGANVMARNAGGLTPLHAAAYSGSVPIATLLLQRGAVLDDAANKGGVTPLMVAGEQNHVALAEFLIAQGADVNHGEVHGYKPIARALWKGNKDIVRLYKQHGATCVAPEIRGAEDWYRQCVEIGQ
jgi:ankyrin repeat protein